jgi:hypothetical protein
MNTCDDIDKVDTLMNDPMCRNNSELAPRMPNEATDPERVQRAATRWNSRTRGNKQ